jgi:hypothetical protein
LAIWVGVRAVPGGQVAHLPMKAGDCPGGCGSVVVGYHQTYVYSAGGFGASGLEWSLIDIRNPSKRLKSLDPPMDWSGTRAPRYI